MMGDNEPIVISTVIKDFEVRRIFIDQGSLADIMFWNLFEKLGFKDRAMQQYKGNLVGFTGNTIKPKGYVKFDVGFGKGTHIKVIQVKFLVVDCPTAYNAINGRPTLNALGAVVSTLHLMMKFYGDDDTIITVK